MAKHNSSASGCGCLIGLAIAGWLFSIHWVLGLIGLIVAAVIVGALAPPTKCQVCGIGLKKASYEWNLQGKKYLVCPNCNRKFEKQQSDAGFDDFKKRLN